MAVKVNISTFVNELKKALERKDGYIMGATGQDPKKWAENSWWYTQYTGSQREKALYWRRNAQRVWDCNGLAEGIYKDFAGVDINTRARYNYANWCSIKGSGMIPKNMRMAGAAVFWGDTASDIHHVAYLFEPVKAENPEGDWYLIEARGVAYGVVRTRLNDRKPNYWGLMDKYFTYGSEPITAPTEPVYELGSRILRNGSEGNDVKKMQENLIQLGYNCGKWGADGEFGDATEMAVRYFQQDNKLTCDGEFGPKSLEAMEKALVIKPVENPEHVVISGGQCFVRKSPSIDGSKIGVARENEKFAYAGSTSENGWLLIKFNGKTGWVSGKYGRLIK